MSDQSYLFVYGTLRPGEERWPVLARYVTSDPAPTTVRGRLYDTGLGYPAAIFDGDASTHIVGDVFELHPDDVDEALAVLDEVEGAVEGLYRRITVQTTGGQVVWAYEYRGGTELVAIASGDWLDRSG